MSMKTTKAHPQHKAREVRNISTGEMVAWSIYPDQIPAMKHAMAKAFNGSYDGHLNRDDLDAMFRAIGLVAPNGEKP